MNTIDVNNAIQKPRVMYLDVDDTLLIWTNNHLGVAAPRAAEFINWSLDHFEVRWLTMWTLSGKMPTDRAQELSDRFGHTIEPKIFEYHIENPNSFSSFKTSGIDFDDPRPWVWVEDGILLKERQILESHKAYHNFYKTNVTLNVVELQRTWKLLAMRFQLPFPYTEYTKEVFYAK